MLTCIDVKFIFNSVRLGLSSSANILQIAEVISNWLWWIKRVLLANQKRGNILNE